MASWFWSTAPIAALATTVPISCIVFSTPDAVPASSGLRSRVARSYTGVQTPDMPIPIRMKPGRSAHRSPSALTLHAMNPRATVNSVSPAKRNGFGPIFWTWLATKPDATIIASGIGAMVRPAVRASNPRTDWK